MSAFCDKFRSTNEERRMAESKTSSDVGIVGLLGILIGGACVLVALVGVLNTAFDLNLALSVSGTSTPLPKHWDEVFGVAAAGVLIMALTVFGGFVRRKFTEAKGKPLLRVGILLGAFALLVMAGRGLQIVALTMTYGSMLAYYSTDGDLDDVKAELAGKPDRAALDQAVDRAAQYNNAPALALLLEAGADMRGSTLPEAQRRCALVGKSYEFIKTAIDHGIKPDACPRGEIAVWEAVKFAKSDDEAAKNVTLLLGGGWSASATPDYDKRSPKKIAAEKKWSKTLQALGDAG
ncbi:hypothetical protein [Polyangium jinanense]|uniref:Ankyrin repeat protein n=1 Tax=Polyangium jinanense TaxID=2829994 RepID=A0A9X3X5F7_9BACT|nr:hypothetical protein [Polyangium jinanense]MDC3981746.1 hypothetical protein [Polyangium jinanense]